MKSNIDFARLLWKKARHDLQAAEKLIRMEGPYDVACFHLQQAAEKFLKAFLEARNLDYPLTHDLELLLDLCPDETGVLTGLREKLYQLEPYAVQIRYDDAVEPGGGEAAEGLGIVLELQSIIIKLMPGAMQPLE